MSSKTPLTYADAGVSIDAGNALVKSIAPLLKATRRSGADGSIGGFGGLFDLKATGLKDPILVAGADGVGTKLKLAIDTGIHDTVGVDLVAMSVNDVLVQGAEPLFFLDYFACGRLETHVAAEVVKGIASGCIDAGCALIGGETAEMPGMYADGEYDLAGFCVGAAERDQLLPHKNITAGDIIIALPSSGVHSNGFSLVRKIIELSGLKLDDPCPFEPNNTLGRALLRATRIYVKTILTALRANVGIKGLVHITGGGLTENIPRVLPTNIGCEIQTSAIPTLPVFEWLSKAGQVSQSEMLRTFNCGVGMILIVDSKQQEEALNILKKNGEKPVVIGKLIPQANSEVIYI